MNHKDKEVKRTSIYLPEEVYDALRRHKYLENEPMNSVIIRGVVNELELDYSLEENSDE